MSSALNGIRVVELGRMVAVPYCAKLLADLGADCVKVERPAGDPARKYGPFPGGVADSEGSGLFLYLNAHKRGVILDPDRAEDLNSLKEHVAGADVFVSDLQPREAERLGLTGAALISRNPGLVAVSVTPFGLSGPRANDLGGELIEWAAGGYAKLTPAGGKREGGRPLKTAGHQAGFMAGASAALAALAALHQRGANGRGQVVDVSIQETLIVANDSTFARYMTDGDNVPTRLVQSTFEFLPCKDGYVSLLFVRDDQWDRMVELMGHPEWATSEVFGGFAGRRANWDAVAALLAEFFGQYGREELYRMAQARRIPLAPVNSAEDVLTCPHLRARGYFVNLPLPDGTTVKAPGAPYKLAGGKREETGGRSFFPLPSSLRLLDFTWVWAGPQACRFLADLGAEVIKIESDRRIDNYRTAAAPDGAPYGLNRSPGFNTLNRNKLSVRINLASPTGRDLALRLAAVSDLVMENYAPRVMRGFGLSWADFARVNPAIVMLSMSGFGGTGPDRDHVLYGNSQVALAGLGHATGFPGGPPENVGIAHGDPVAAYHAAYAALAAVYAARRTGHGQHIDMSQWEAMAATVPEVLLEYGMNGVEPPRRGNADPLMAPHGYYRCAGDDAWIGIAIETDRQWQALCAVMDRPAWCADPAFATPGGRLAHAPRLDALVESWTVSQDARMLERRLQDAGVPAALVASIADIAADPHLAARGFFEEIDHPEVGRQRYIGVPFKLSETPARLYRPAPLFGGDAEYVLQKLLGLSAGEIAELHAAGALH